MKKIVVFFLLFMSVYSYEVGVFNENRIFFDKDILEYQLKESPAEAVFNLKQESSATFIFESSTLGRYTILFTDAAGEISEKNIDVVGKNYTLTDIETLLKTKDIYDKIKEVYLTSADILQSQKTIYEFLLNKSRQKDNIDYILNVFFMTKLFMKNFQIEQKQFLEQLFLNKRELGDIRAEVLTLKLLKSYNNYYTLLYGQRALETGIDEENALRDLKNLVDENLDKEAAKLVGKYYIDRGSPEGEKYLYLADKKEFFRYLFNKDNREKLEFYLNKLNSADKEEMLKLKSEFDKEKIIFLYLQKGKLNLEQSRYDLSKEYYGKVIEFSKDEKQLKEALFNLGKISIYQENYEKAMEVFDTYLKKYDNVEEVEALFYLGLCNFKLKNLEKSDIIFNRIKKTYKYSIWDEKIKILLKEI